MCALWQRNARGVCAEKGSAMNSNKRFHHLLMVMLGVVVLWSLLGISVQVGDEGAEYRLFIKQQPSAQLVFNNS